MNARRAAWACGVLLLSVALGSAVRAQAPERLATYQVVGDAIPQALTTTPGDAARGRAIVVNKQLGLCLLCHTGPFDDEPFQGNLAPDLAGVGARLTEGQLRLRLVDGRRTHPTTIMPAYHRTEGLVRVGPAWQGKPLLAAQQVEDVVAFLLTLRAAR
jgi:sulfur-oxidizing protein SoxX